MRIIVAGGRTFTNQELLFATLDKLTAKMKEVVVISGHAKGADQLGEEWAYQRRKTMEIYRADWSKGKSAGPIRNQQMIDEGKPDGLVLFWDGKSPGSKNMLQLAKKAKLKIKVVYF